MKPSSGVIFFVNAMLGMVVLNTVTRTTATFMMFSKSASRSQKNLVRLFQWNTRSALPYYQVNAFSTNQINSVLFPRKICNCQSDYQDSKPRFWKKSSTSSPSSQRLYLSTDSASTTSTAKISSVFDSVESKPRIPKKFVPKPFQYHEEVTIRIDSLTNMGWGVGRVKLDDDDEDDSTFAAEGGAEEQTDKEKKVDRLWVIMVPHVVVGELVKVRIFRNQRNYSEGDLVEVIEASPNRVEPKCSLAGICGGCQYQHMSIASQREWKTLHCQEVLLQQSIEGYDTVDAIAGKLIPTIGTDEVFGYRSKLTPHYEAPREIGLDTFEMEAIGFQKSSNRQLVDVPECPIATPAINEAFKATRVSLHEQAPTGVLNKKKKKRRRGSRGGKAAGATLLFRQADDDEDGNPVVISDHNEYMTTTVKGIKFRYLAGNFFQNNNYVLPLMVDSVLEAAIAPATIRRDADKSHQLSYLIDCYCGSGLFALSAAKDFSVCVGIEVNEKAIAEAQDNAKLNDIDNCHFVAASAEAIFTSPPTVPVPVKASETSDGATEKQASEMLLKVSDFPRDDTVVVLDPPRKGCSPEFLEQLYEYSPQRIVYMSCGPATQARDAKGIVEIGGYDIVSIQPFDLFPQTKHIECLIVFEKRVKQ